MVPHATSDWRSRIVVAVAVAIVVAPAIRDRASFPLSTYPIYANVRERNITINVAVGIEPAGARQPLGLAVIADTDDPLIAQSTLDRAVASRTADDLCRLIAGRSAADVIAIEIAREQHDLIDRATGHESLEHRDVIARCEVAP